MKKTSLLLVFIALSSLCFSLELSPFIRKIVDADARQMVETLDNTGAEVFNHELIRLVNGLSYREPYFYSYDRLDAYTVRQLSDCFMRTYAAGGDEVRWIWDKIWNMLVMGAGLSFDEGVNAYEVEMNRLYELARRPDSVYKSRYENDLTGFARLILSRPALDRRPRQPQPPVPAAVSPVIPVVNPAPEPAAASAARIVPQIPSPDSGKVYRLQVGSYHDIDFALEAVTRLRNAGFFPAYEINGDYYRVVVSGIPASEISIAARILGSAGFGEVWIREER